MANEILTEILIDLRKANASLERFEKEAKESGNRGGKQIAGGLEAGMNRAFGGLTKRVVALGATLLAAFGAKKIIQGAMEQENAVNRLNQAMRNAGDFSEAASLRFQNFARDLQKASVIGDETSISMLALAKSFGATNTMAQQVVQAAADLSAATGKSLEDSVTALGRSLGGTGGALAKINPAFKNLTDEALRSGEAVRIALTRFGGSALAQLNTFSGALAFTKNAFSDVLEEIGTLIIKSPVVVGVLKRMGLFFADLAESIAKIGSKGDVVGDFIKSMVDISITITGVVGPVIELLINWVKEVGRTYGAVGAALMALANGEITQAMEIIKLRVADFKMDELLSFDGTLAAQNFLLKVQEFLGGIAPLKSMVKTELDKTIQVVSDFQLKLNQLWQNGVVGSVSKGIQGVVQALKNGQSAWVGFRDSVRVVIGQMLIAQGEAIILQSSAVQAISALLANPFTSAAGAIAWGAALIALGSVLSQSAADGAARGAGGTGGGSASTASMSNPVLDTSLSEVEREEAGTRVVVNVQGNILDRRQTGLELAEVINEAFSSNGVVIAQAGG